MEEKREYIWKEFAKEKPKEEAVCWVKVNDLDPPRISTFSGEKFIGLSRGGQAFYSPCKYWMPVPDAHVLEQIEITLASQAKTVELAQAGVKKFQGMLQAAIAGIVQIMQLPPEKNMIVQFKEGGSGNCSQVIAGEIMMELKKQQTGDEEDFFSNVTDLNGNRIRKDKLN